MLVSFHNLCLDQSKDVYHHSERINLLNVPRVGDFVTVPVGWTSNVHHGWINTMFVKRVMWHKDDAHVYVVNKRGCKR